MGLVDEERLKQVAIWAPIAVGHSFDFLSLFRLTQYMAVDSIRHPERSVQSHPSSTRQISRTYTLAHLADPVHYLTAARQDFF